jgi:hypothetical protein
MDLGFKTAKLRNVICTRIRCIQSGLQTTFNACFMTWPVATEKIFVINLFYLLGSDSGSITHV